MLGYKEKILRADSWQRTPEYSGNEKKMTFRAFVRLQVAAVLLAGCACTLASPLPPDLTSIPLEQLMQLEVTTASKYTQRATEAPADVTVITAADIRAYGYRTLHEALRSIRGIHTSYDRNYAYLGVRGFSRAGDYNTRVLLLVDGMRLNDGIFDTAPIDLSFPLDLELIDRIEFVAGPGSAIYGNNAFFGVVNVITRKGLRGGEAGLAASSGEAYTGRLSYGGRSEDGLDWLLSVSGHDSQGKDLYYPEFDGTARGLDGERSRRLFARLGYGAVSLQAVHAWREKGIPTASFSQAFNDPRSQTQDGYTYLNLGYSETLGPLNLVANLYHYRYDYTGDYVYDYPPLTLNRDVARNRAWGGDLRADTEAISGHRLIFGAEFRHDLRRDQSNFDLDPRLSYLDDRREKQSLGVYLQDEIHLGKAWRLNLGLRHDRSGDEGSTNPRLGLIWLASRQTTAKLLYGTAFRAPNAYELYYVTDASSQKAPEHLDPENIRSLELVLEHRLREDTRLLVAAYHNHIDRLIGLTTDPADGKLVYANLGHALAKGLELELERHWSGGSRLRASYARQLAEDGDTGLLLPNAPRHLAKLNFSSPLPLYGLSLGLEAQYTSSRRTLKGASLGGYPLLNLTLTAPRLAKGLELSVSVYNLLDRSYADPGSEEHVQDAIPQDGRSWRLRLTHFF